MSRKPELTLNTTTLWEYPSQHYGSTMQGDKNYVGATPSYIIWNLLNRYTKPKDLVVDPMCGSGTTIDVCKDLNRKVIGYDINPYRSDIVRNDARKIPIEDNKVDFVFIDPPYSDHIDYSDQKGCIGKLAADGEEFYQAMEMVIAECFRIMKKDRCMGLYICDFFNSRTGFVPTGFKVYEILLKYFKPIDVVSVVRHNKSLAKGNWHKTAQQQNFFLRGFNYLFIMQKATRHPIKDEIPRQNAKQKSNPRPKADIEEQYENEYTHSRPSRQHKNFDKRPRSTTTRGAKNSRHGKPAKFSNERDKRKTKKTQTTPKEPGWNFNDNTPDFKSAKKRKK